jgi:hypothetical protein
LLLVATCLWACKHKSAIAELTKADGPVERQESGDTAWNTAKVGAEFFIGDAARTADTGAELKLGGSAKIAMQPHTVLRFGGKDGASKISVELGAIDLSGSGNYGLDVGDVNLKNNGAIRITAKGKGESEFELLVGNAQISNKDGTLDLEIGKIYSGLDIGTIKVNAAVDAGVDADLADAAVDAPVDTSGDAEIAITGKKAEILKPGETKWTALAPDTTSLAKGTQLRLGANTSAKLTALGTTVDLSGGSKLTISDALIFSIDNGSARATVPAKGEGKVTVPGGELALSGTPLGPAEAKLDVNARETKVQVIRPNAKLTGAGGATLDMAGGTATIAKAGTIRVVEAIPNYFDIRVLVGDTPNFAIHDPKPPTAVQFQFNGKCPGGGVIEMDKDARFRTPKISAGREAANMLVQPGGWAYRLRCGDNGAAVASGRISVLRDDGHRPLPPKPGKNPIDADGRNYTISYQSSIPIVAVHFKGTGSAFKLHLATGGTEETFDSTTPVIEVPSAKLKEATYTFWVDHDGVKQDKVSTLKINFDQTAPQVYIEAPTNGQPFGAEIEVKGAVLPGWTAKVDVVEIPIDTKRRFSAKVPPPPGNALAIRLSHPQRGTHFYLRRGTK